MDIPRCMYRIRRGFGSDRIGTPSFSASPPMASAAVHLDGLPVRLAIDVFARIAQELKSVVPACEFGNSIGPDVIAVKQRDGEASVFGEIDRIERLKRAVPENRANRFHLSP